MGDPLDRYLAPQSPPEEESADPLDGVLAARRREMVNANMLRDGIDPERAGRANGLARETGLPADMVERNLSALETERLRRAAQEVIDRHTAIGKWAINPRNAAVARDDMQNLGFLGNAWEGLKKIPGRLGAGGWTVGEGLTDIYNTAEEVREFAETPLDAAMSAVAGATGLYWLDPARGRKFTVGQREQRSAYFRDNAAATRERNRGGGWLSEGLLAGVESVPMTIGAALTRNPRMAAGTLGTVSGVSAYAEARRQGVDPGRAVRYGATQGLAEAVTERIPVGTLVDLIARKTPWGKAFVRELGQEMTGEQVATVLQDMNDWAFLPENSSKTMAEFVAERPGRALETALAAVGGTATTVGGIGAAQRATDAAIRVADRVEQVRQAREERRFFERAAKAVEGSKLRQRDPEALKALLREQAEDAGASFVFIPGEAVRAYQQSDSYDDQSDPFSRYDVDEAATAGGDIVIPIEDALADLVGTPAWEAVRDDMRLAPGGMSPREAETFDEAMADVMAEMGDQAALEEQADAEFRTVREKIVDRVAQMFGASFTSPTARTFAELFAQRVQTRAERMGQQLTPEAVDGFEVRQVLPEGIARAVKANSSAPLDRTLKPLLELMQRKGGPQARSDKAKFGPSLLDWIASRGGIEDRGGDLKAMGLASMKGRARKWERKLIRPHVAGQASMLGSDGQQNSNSPDELALRAWEAGYFPEFAERPTTDDLLGAIAEGISGRERYAQQETEEADQLRDAAQELYELLDSQGIDPTTATLKQASEVIARYQSERAGGLSFEQLFEDPKQPERTMTAEQRAELGARQQQGMARRSGQQSVKDQDGGLFSAGRDQESLFQTYDEGARGRIVFDQNQRIIELFQSRNLSTPLHELSHMWLEELRFDAEQESAPDQLQADWQTVKAYFSANGHPIGEDGQIPVDAHELWARSGERYFMEGKAPTSALVRMFESFRAWLVNIYKTVDRLRAPISPEIREVFDRLLATDAEIAAAQERQGLAALFKDAAAIGMTEPEFQAYQRQVDDARAGAHAALLDKTMRTIRRRETERYSEARKKIRAEEQERILASPVFKALALMKEQRISREWVEEAMGSEALSLLPVRVPPLHAPGGTHPDIIAEQAGYSSGQAMIETLIDVEAVHREAREAGDPRTMRERAIEDATNAEFERRYGDPLNDGSIEREAIAAVHSEMQGEVIASELRILSRKAGRRPTPYALAREWAREKVRTGTVTQEASPGAIQRYARNAAKAGRAAEEAMLAQDIEETFRQKQFQMMNNALVAEAKAAADEVGAAVKRMDKIARTRTRKSVDQDYLEQAHALLEAVDLRQRSQISIDRQGQWEEFAAARQAEGYDVVVPASFEATINRTNWSRLSVENLLALDEAVKQIIHLGRHAQTVIDEMKEREWNEIFAEAEGNADNIGRKPPKGSFTDPNWWDSLKAGVLTVDAALLKMEQVFDWLDQGNISGVFNRIVFRPIAEAQAREQDMTRDYFARIHEALEAVPKDTVRRWGDKVELDLIDPATGLPAVFERKRLVSMALNWGNAGNRQRLADGYGWSPQGVEAALMEHLTEAEWQFVQKTWDIIDTLWPEIEAMERAINGVAPEKVEAVEIVTPFGAFRGGYYPAIYDTTLDYRAEELAGRKADLFESAYTRATTRASATKERMEKVSRPILLDIGVINRHLGEVIHDVTHREAVMRAHKFLTSARVMKAVDETLGPEMRKQFRPWLQHIANSWAQDRAGSEGLGKFFSKARANATVVGMGWRFTTMLTQMAGYSNSFEKVGAKWVSAAIAQSSTRPIESFNFVMERSGEMRGRMDTIDRDIRAEMARMGSRVGAAANRLTDAKRFAFHGIGYMDRVVSIPTWLGAYNKAISEGMSEEEASYAGDKAIRLSQGAAGPKDLAAVATGQGRFGVAFQWLTMFYSYLSTVYSRQRNLGRDVRRAEVSDLPGLMARAWWLIVVPPLLAELLSGRGPGDDEDATWWAFKRMLLQSLGAIPGVRDVAEPVFAELTGSFTFGYRLSPLQASGESVVKVAKDAGRIYRGEETKRATRDVMEMTGYFTGLIPGQLAASTQFLVDVGHGEADPETISDWYTGLTKGRLPEE